MNQPWVYICSPSWTPFPSPSPSHPAGSSQCTSPEHPVSCIETGLAICFTYDKYMFQCYSLKSSHPCLLPTVSPKDRSLHLCLFCCLACRVIVNIFLNSIYMHSYTVLVFFFLAYFTLYNSWCCLVTKSCPTLATPQTTAHQPPLSMGFFRQEYWNG